MRNPRSKLTAKGQISVPAEIRRKLGLGPGSVIEWDVDQGQVVLRRVGCFTSDEVHQALFGPTRPKRRSIAELKAGIGRHLKTRSAGVTLRRSGAGSRAEK